MLRRSSSELPPRKSGKRFRGVGHYLDNTFCGRFEPIVSFENFERRDVVTVVVLSMMHESRFRMNPNGALANLLRGQAARRESNFVETL